VPTSFVAKPPVFALLISCSAVACTLDDDEGRDEPFAGEIDPELRKSKPPAKGERPEVGLFFAQSGEACTATLIDARTALTASHCVDDRNANDGPTRGRIGFDLAGGGTASARVVGWSVPRPGSGATRNDIALLHIDPPVTSIAPAAYARSRPKKGDGLTTYGYGYQKCGEQKLKGGPAWQKRVARWKFGTDPEILCDGDSGGPTFGPDGTLVLVSSRVEGDARDRIDRFTPIAPHAAWIAARLAR
jgi:hypothetical protein